MAQVHYCGLSSIICVLHFVYILLISGTSSALNAFVLVSQIIGTPSVPSFTQLGH